MTLERPRLGDTLEVVKFLCKDLWAAVFRKQIDNLKTNHRGVYVLTDNSFRWLSPLTPVTVPLNGHVVGGAAVEAAAAAASSAPLPLHSSASSPAAFGAAAAAAAGALHPQQLAAQHAAFQAQDALRRAVAAHLHVPCGLIRGALTALGVACTVEADPKGLPSCAFIIKIAS